MTEPKRGRPKKAEPREALTFVGFKADAEVMEALEVITYAASLERGVVRPRSVALRRAVVEAAARVPREQRRASDKAD